MVRVNKPASVTVEYSGDYQALWMAWDKEANKRDVEGAYREISAYLNTVDTPICVIVDLRKSVYMPLKETLSGALYGPYNHPNINAWLILGTNPITKFIASTLTNLTKKDKVIWFDTEAELQAYMEANCQHLVR